MSADKNGDHPFAQLYANASWNVLHKNFTELSERVKENSERLAEIEKKQFGGNAEIFESDGEFARRTYTSFATAHDDGYGGLATCARIIKSNRLASVQCVWLVSCMLFFGYFMYYEWSRTNHSGEFRPQKKSKIVNFAYGQEEYDMPYFSLLVATPTDNIGFNDIISKMINESEFLCYYYFDYDPSNNFQAEISYNQSDEYDEQSVTFWWVNIIPENPIPGKGPWHCTWSFMKENFTHALFFVNRMPTDISSGSFEYMHLSFSANETAVISFDYSEMVIEKQVGGTVHEFMTSIDEIYVPKDPHNEHNVELDITMYPKVEYWEEYEDYTLQDAISSLGGVLTILCMVYFWVAYYIAVSLRTNPWEMGILPQMSFVFHILEKILVLQDCLEEFEVIPRASRITSYKVNTNFKDLKAFSSPKRLLSIDTTIDL